MTRLFRVCLPYAVFGIVVDENERVVEAAPIGKWTIGRGLDYVTGWVLAKGGSIESPYDESAGG